MPMSHASAFNTLQIFNYKIYHPFRRTARIVHMHGPKMNHYLEYFRTGKCGRFEGLCEQVGWLAVLRHGLSL